MCRSDRILVMFVIFFFFQAEDGIRDKLVTGVQTCALPISSSRSPFYGGRCFGTDVVHAAPAEGEAVRQAEARVGREGLPPARLEPAVARQRPRERLAVGRSHGAAVLRALRHGLHPKVAIARRDQARQVLEQADVAAAQDPLADRLQPPGLLPEEHLPLAEIGAGDAPGPFVVEEDAEL